MTNPLVQQANQKAKDIDELIRKFYDRVNSVLSWVPKPLEYLIDPILKGMEFLGQKCKEFWNEVNELWDKLGDVDKLRFVAEGWVTHVGDALNEIAGTIGLDKMRTTIEWEGRAARAYQATVPPQPAGLNSIKDVAGQMRSSLNNLANALEGFWIAIGFALAGFVIGIVAAIAAACTVVGTPIAIGAIATAAGAAVALIGAAVVAVVSYMNTIDTEQSAIRQKIRDLGSSWTMPNLGDLSDASVRDGDGSDWRPGS